MAAFGRFCVLGVVCLASLGAAQRSDQVAAERVLGPRWRQMSRSAGMIFSGTVLNVDNEPAEKETPIPLVLIRFRVDRAVAGVRAGEVLTVREWAGAWSTHRAMRSGQRWLIFLYPLSRLGLTSPLGGAQGQVVLDARGQIIQANVVDLPAARAEILRRDELETSVAKVPFLNSDNAALKRCSTQTFSGNRAGVVQFQDGASAVNERCFIKNSAAILSGAAMPPVITLRQLERAIRATRVGRTIVPERNRECTCSDDSSS
jgi:hypothetical protein